MAAGRNGVGLNSDDTVGDRLGSLDGTSAGGFDRKGVPACGGDDGKGVQARRPGKREGNAGDIGESEGRDGGDGGPGDANRARRDGERARGDGNRGGLERSKCRSVSLHVDVERYYLTHFTADRFWSKVVIMVKTMKTVAR